MPPSAKARNLVKPAPRILQNVGKVVLVEPVGGIPCFFSVGKGRVGVAQRCRNRMLSRAQRFPLDQAKAIENSSPLKVSPWV